MFGDILGNKNLDQLLGKIDGIIDRLSHSNQSLKNPEELISATLNDVIKLNSASPSSSSEIKTGSFDQIFTEINIPKQRLDKYDIFDEIYRSIQIVKRILSVYINNIFQKDSVTNRVLFIKETESSKKKNNSEEYRLAAQKAIEFFRLEHQSKEFIAFITLKYGDSFVEIINLDEVVVDFPTVQLSDYRKTNSSQINLKQVEESVNFISDPNYKFKNGKTSAQNNVDEKLIYQHIDTIVDYFVEFSEITKEEIRKENELLFEDFQSIKEDSPKAEHPFSTATDDSESDFSRIKSKDKFDNQRKKQQKQLKESDSKFSHVVLKYHKPHHIVPLVTAYNNILGYVEVKDLEKMYNDINNPLVSFINIVNKISSSKIISTELTDKEKQDRSIEILAQSISKKVLLKYGIIKQSSSGKPFAQQSEEYQEGIKKILDRDLYYILKRMLLTSSKTTTIYNKKLSVRYIKPDSIVHFRVPNSDNYPLGRSILEPLVYPGKLYILTQLSNAVIKLSRSSLIRKWTIETGTKENSSALIERLKRSFKNTRITAEDLATSRSIPNLVSDFKDLLTFTKKGQRFVDVDIQSFGDSSVSIRDLEDIRNELIALSGVPASYLGYDQNFQLREKLIHSNISFATEISNLQDNFNKGLTELLTRILFLSGKKESLSKYVTISLMPPTVLLLQLVESSINSVNTIVNSLQSIPNMKVNPLYLLKRYVPYIDWDEFEKEAQDFNVQNKLTQPPMNPPQQPNAGGF